MFLTAEVGRFYEAWKALRMSEAFPHYRALFDALAPDLIPGMMLLEEAPDEMYIVRFMGTALVDLWGVDLTGRDRFSAVSAKVAAAGRRNLKELLGTPCGVTGQQVYGVREVEALLLPVENDPGKPRRVAGYAQPLARDPITGLAEAGSALDEKYWIDLGSGIPRRPPIALFSKLRD